MKNIFKRIGLIAIAIFVGVGSLFFDFSSNNNSVVASASVTAPNYPLIPDDVIIRPSIGDVTTNEGLTFYGSDIIYSSISFRTNSTLVTDFSKYSDSSDSGYYYNSSLSYFNFCFGLSIPSSNDFVFYYYANRGSVGIYNPDQFIITNSTTGVPAGVFYSTTLNGFSLTNLRSGFQSGGIFSRSGVTPMQGIYAYGSIYAFNFGFEIYRNNTETSSFVNPSLSMYYVILTNTYEMEEYLGITPKFTNSNVICYIDTAGYYYIYYIPFSETANNPNNQSFYLQYRRYILQDVDLTDNQYYQQGVSDGNASGYNNGYNDGYSEGSSIGYDNGYNEGLIDGVVEANDYSFFGLISAVIDAPVSILASLFNFTFLGIDLWLFITSILTISLVIFVIRKFMGKG